MCIGTLMYGVLCVEARCCHIAQVYRGLSHLLGVGGFKVYVCLESVSACVCNNLLT